MRIWNTHWSLTVSEPEEVGYPPPPFIFMGGCSNPRFSTVEGPTSKGRFESEIFQYFRTLCSDTFFIMENIMSYTKLYSATVPQSEPLSKDQVRNAAGGYVFSIDIWQRLKRFLILGSDSNTYYQQAKALTKENAAVVNECWSTDPFKTAVIIREISMEGRAPKQDAGIFALALGAVHPNLNARQAAYLVVNDVCRTASTLFLWISNARALGKGTGRGMKRTIANWYKKFDTNGLALQAIKYRNRKNFTHKRLIEFCHQGAGKDDLLRQNLYKWMRGKEADSLPPLVAAHKEAMALENSKASVKRLVDLIIDYKLPWEAIPTWALTEMAVWNALIPSLGLTAIIRNLGTMTHCGAIGLQHWKHVTAKLNKTALQKARIHPFSVLLAMSVYRNGKAVKAGQYRSENVKTWTPVPQVLDALDAAFYMTFKNIEPTNKRILLALDVSGSMTYPLMGSPLTCREAAAAMALVTMATEPNYTIMGFTSKNGGNGGWSRWASSLNVLTPLDLSPKQRLDDVVKKTSNLPFGTTDCSLPFLWAMEEKYDFDAVVTLTDSETWCGSIHPSEALKKYRQFSGIYTKSIVVGMTSQGFSIADPNDTGSLDVVGFDTAAPALMNDFIRA